MGRKQRLSHLNKKTPDKSELAGVYPTSSGSVEVRADSFSPGDWEVLVNGVPSSHISQDPLRLEYEYMRWIVAAIEPWVENCLDPQKLRVTHLGGGACSLARYMVARYPASRNTVVEIDGDLARMVREWFDLPRSPQLKIRVGDARTVTDSFVDRSRDIIIRDVFAGDQTPSSLRTIEFFHQVAASLDSSGLYCANCGDHSDLSLAKSELKTMGEIFPYRAAIADPAMLKGRRYGNMILLASSSPLPLRDQAPHMTKMLLRGAVPAQYKDEEWVKQFCASGKILHD
ncbi:spermidine synthase [Corynebacterium sp. ES2715-CONJ3]|uniref:spermidine synthase n=1 Tax=Corynebacterium sp. ES2715-CONJ3 TaxID=2974028 RepID=UPI0037BE85B2